MLLILGLGFLLQKIILPLALLNQRIHSLAQSQFSDELQLECYSAYHEISKNLSLHQRKFIRISEFVQRLGKGDFDFNAQQPELAQEDDAIFQTLVNTQGYLRNNQNATQKRNWASEGIANSKNCCARKNKNLESLSNVVVAFIVNYLEANQGALFLLNDTNPHKPVLELRGCYAYGRQKFMDKAVRPG